MHRVDVLREPLPDRQALGGAAQHAGMAMNVDEARHQQPVRQFAQPRLRVIALQIG
jgi:hypothetical protein